MLQYPVVQPYDRNRAALVSTGNGIFLGVIGEFKPSVTRALKLPRRTAGFEIDTANLETLLVSGPSYRPLSKFPSVWQDITLKAPNSVTYSDLYDLVNTELAASAPQESSTDLAGYDIFQKDDSHRQTTFRVTITAADRTLTDKEVSQVLDNVAAQVKSKVGAERI